jgi:SAM-dependent methyltransferase
MFTLNDIQYLASRSGERLLERLATEDLSDANTLRLLTALRKDYTADQARAGLEMARLRLKAVDKFGDDASRMFFTREALEQASDPLVRRYRAALIGGRSIIDACCGIGADSLAFARSGADVLGLDIDPVRVAIARYNNDALGLKVRFEAADVTAGIPDADVAFFDPARRDERGNRIYDVEQYQPPLSTIRVWKHPLIAVKLSPGVDLDQLKSYGGQVEFISAAGDLKEAVLWVGETYTRLRATLLIGEQVLHWARGGEAETPPDETPIDEPCAWLVEPDPAILRAGLVQDVAAHFKGYMLDETIAYFTADERPESPWVRAWRVLDWMPFNLKKLRDYLNERNVGTVTVKKRGSAITPEELIAKLKLKGSESRTLVLTRCQGAHIVIICEDYQVA